MIIKTFTNKKHQNVGALHESGVYRTNRRGSLHLLKVMDAWGVDEEIINELQKHEPSSPESTAKPVVIRLLDLERHEMYEVLLSVFIDKAILKDFGFGKQLFLPRRYWIKKDVAKEMRP